MKRGTKFNHKHWLSLDDEPAVCEVTCVRDGVVFYKRVSPGVSDWRTYKGSNVLLKMLDLGKCKIENFDDHCIDLQGVF